MSCIPARKTIPITSSCACNQPRGMSHVAWFGRPMTPRNIPELPPERGLGNPAVARDQVGGKDAVPDEPLAFAVELRCDLVGAPTGPWRQRRVVQHPGGGTGRGPRRRRCGRRLAEAPECRPREGGEREHGRLPPQDLRSRDRRHGHRLDLDVGARLISVDLHEHVADAQGRALVVGDDDLDLFHTGHCRGMTTDVATGLSRATARLTASATRAASTPLPVAGCYHGRRHAAGRERRTH